LDYLENDDDSSDSFESVQHDDPVNQEFDEGLDQDFEEELDEELDQEFKETVETEGLDENVKENQELDENVLESELNGSDSNRPDQIQTERIDTDGSLIDSAIELIERKKNDDTPLDTLTNLNENDSFVDDDLVAVDNDLVDEDQIDDLNGGDRDPTFDNDDHIDFLENGHVDHVVSGEYLDDDQIDLYEVEDIGDETVHYKVEPIGNQIVDQFDGHAATEKHVDSMDSVNEGKGFTVVDSVNGLVESLHSGNQVVVQVGEDLKAQYPSADIVVDQDDDMVGIGLLDDDIHITTSHSLIPTLDKASFHLQGNKRELNETISTGISTYFSDILDNSVKRMKV
jgi:hypothetical protein